MLNAARIKDSQSNDATTKKYLSRLPMFVFLTASRNCIRKIKFIEHFQKHKLQTNSLPCSGKYLSHEGENTHFTSLLSQTGKSPPFNGVGDFRPWQ